MIDPLLGAIQSLDWKARAEKAEAESNKKTEVIAKMSDVQTELKAEVERLKSAIRNHEKACVGECATEYFKADHFLWGLVKESDNIRESPEGGE